MHSISTRATTHGRRRNVQRLGVAAAGTIAASGLVAGVAFAAPVPPSIGVAPTTPSPDLNTPAGLLTFKITITNNDTVSPEDVADLYLATCAASTGNAPTPGKAICKPTDSAPGLDIRSIRVDPTSPANCGPASFVPVNPQPNGANADYTVSGMFIGTSSFCAIDVTVAPGASPSNTPEYFLATADTVVNGVSGTPSAAPAPVAAQINLIPGPTTPPPPPPPANFPPPGNFPPPPAPVTPPPPPPVGHHAVPHCAPGTPNNGNGNTGYGNNGNGNVGDCNNGNGNFGDDNNGNGNGFDSPGDE
jgi:hypothetical protein